MSQLDYRGKERAQFQTHNELPSKTIQSDADRADIKHILKRFRETGIVDNLNITEATFADVTAFTDYADVMNMAKEAEASFMKLPSKVREIFNHDVGTWLDTAHDEEKRAALIAAGEIQPQQESGETNLPANAGTDENPKNDNPSPD